MGIDKIIDDLYEILDSSWNLPLSGGKIIVDSKELRCLLEDLRLKLPKEVIQAQNIVQERSNIIEDAKEEADRMIKASEDRIRTMVNQSEIVKNAQIVANKMVSDAKLESKEIKFAANQYVENLMRDVEHSVSAGLSELKKARQTVSSSEYIGN